MRKILMITILTTLFSCSSYTIKIQSPNEWFKNNFKNQENTVDYTEIKDKLKDLSNNKTTNIVEKEIIKEENKIKNISNTDAYNDNNNFFKKIEPEKENKEELINNMKKIIKSNDNELKELFTSFNSNENVLIEYISEKVLENKEEIKNIIINGYKELKTDKNILTREKYIAMLAKYVRDKNINNFTYVADRVNANIEEGK